MKKITLLFAVLFACLLSDSIAQSDFWSPQQYYFANYDTIEDWTKNKMDIEFKNTGSDTLNFRVIKVALSGKSDARPGYCDCFICTFADTAWNVFEPDTNTTTIELVPDVNCSFQPFVDPGFSESSLEVKYTFFDVDNKTEPFDITICWNCPGDITENENFVFELKSQIPANENIIFNYDFNNQLGKIEIIDILGKRVNSKSINEPKGTLNLSTTDLNSGIYFYQLSLENKIVKTEKFVIAH